MHLTPDSTREINLNAINHYLCDLRVRHTERFNDILDRGFTLQINGKNRCAPIASGKQINKIPVKREDNHNADQDAADGKC